MNEKSGTRKKNLVDVPFALGKANYETSVFFIRSIFRGVATDVVVVDPEVSNMINLLFDKDFAKIIVTAILIYCGLC